MKIPRKLALRSVRIDESTAVAQVSIRSVSVGLKSRVYFA